LRGLSSVSRAVKKTQSAVRAISAKKLPVSPTVWEGASAPKGSAAKAQGAVKLLLKKPQWGRAAQRQAAAWETGAWSGMGDTALVPAAPMRSVERRGVAGCLEMSLSA